MTPSERLAFRELAVDGGEHAIERAIAVECPCAIEVEGLGYAVMMLTPADLDDFAYGFCLSERLIEDAADIVSINRHEAPHGIVLRISLRPALRPRALERVRHRVSDSSCGLCGIENLEQALRPLPRVVHPEQAIAPDAIFSALKAIRNRQPLNRATGAVHAAAACDPDGAILLTREDVGRHNAFDKLIGAMLRSGADWRPRFALLSSRCSYELVEKSALAGCATLVTISAATTLALERAAEAGITLISLARDDSVLRLAAPDSGAPR